MVGAICVALRGPDAAGDPDALPLSANPKTRKLLLRESVSGSGAGSTHGHGAVRSVDGLSSDQPDASA
jgi:hypothetical protein